ncbi:MAG: hypothetical protein FJ088_09490, partial [Deltaproteobacteria bacterium]|nr:hypothetical protein [Deltaproteobacteria bacterium]
MKILEFFTSGDFPDRIRRTQIVIIIMSVAFFIVCIAIEGNQLWKEYWALAALYSVSFLALGFSFFLYFLKFIQAIQKQKFLREILFENVMLLAALAFINKPIIFALLIFIRQFFILFRFVSRSGAGQQFIQNLEKNPAKLLALSFGAIILFGTL